MSTRVGIVVVSWNGGAQTLACVESARAQTYTDRFIVLVDNASRPEERAQLEAHFGACSDVHVCLLDDNTGYAAASNLGMQQALQAGADLLFLATQDTELAPDALARCIAV